MNSNNPLPLVSIGLPVYNGENYLDQCISSVLNQSYHNIELIISDNASIDRSSEIVEKYLRQDDRVRYYRNEKNLGAQPNYDKTFELANGPFFKWIAHDDLIYPTYIEECVNNLMEHPQFVFCQSLIEFTDSDLNTKGIHQGISDQDESTKTEERFRDFILKPHPCMDVFGVFRKEYLKNSLLHGTYPGSDRALLAEMALKGPSGFINKPLLRIREHKSRYTQSIFAIRQKLKWYNTSQDKIIYSPTLALYKDYLGMVSKHIKSFRLRSWCYFYLILWWFTNWNAIRIGVDLISNIFPDFLHKAELLKQKYISPAPRHRYK